MTADRREYFRQWNEAHAEERRLYMRDYYQANKQRWVEWGRKQRFTRRRMTEDEFDQMLDTQDGGCAICRVEGQPLVIDHDHATGEIRGLLCHACNLGLGKLHDDPVLVERALAYLRKLAPGE